jgi:hypothetical protein
MHPLKNAAKPALIKIRAAQMEPASPANHFAAVCVEFRRTVGTEGS